MTMSCASCGRAFETTEESPGGKYCPRCWKERRLVLIRGLLRDASRRLSRPVRGN